VALRLSPELYLVSTECQKCRSQWPWGRRSEAARLQRLRVRIPPKAWMSVVSVVCSQVEVSATGRSLVRRSPTDCTLETKPTQHVWTDSGRRSRNQPRYCLCQRLHETDPTVWPKQVGLFRADSLARHLLQFSCDSRVVAMDKTYLIELV